MMEPTFDVNGYPSDWTCEQLTQWPGVANDALNFLAAAWNRTYGSLRTELSEHEREVVNDEPGRRYLRLATGGWSGNEALIDAFRSDPMMWHLVWCLQGRGGFYILRYQV